MQEHLWTVASSIASSSFVIFHLLGYEKSIKYKKKKKVQAAAQ